MNYSRNVRNVGSNVILGGRVKIVLLALDWRRHSLVLGAKLPPLGVVIVLSYVSSEDTPAPLVDYVIVRNGSNTPEGLA